MPAGDSLKTSELLEYYITAFKICDGGVRKCLPHLFKNGRGFNQRDYNKSLIRRNLYTAIRNVAVIAWITLPWVSYLLAYAVLLFGSNHYGPIGKQADAIICLAEHEPWGGRVMGVMGNLRHGDRVTRVSWWNKHITPQPTYGTAECQTYDDDDEKICVCSISCAQGGIFFFFMWLKIFQQWQNGIGVLFRARCATEIWISDILLCLKPGLEDIPNTPHGYSSENSNHQ